ncbi:MAG: hypothetical protein H6712_11010 [Myxococcales bacterium]|nr:hypothetical protein [Myxococcales bacterium]
MEHVALGHTNAQIGEALGSSPHTTRNRVAQVAARISAFHLLEARLAVLHPSTNDQRRE